MLCQLLAACAESTTEEAPSAQSGAAFQARDRYGYAACSILSTAIAVGQPNMITETNTLVDQIRDQGRHATTPEIRAAAISESGYGDYSYALYDECVSQGMPMANGRGRL